MVRKVLMISAIVLTALILAGCRDNYTVELINSTDYYLEVEIILSFYPKFQKIVTLGPGQKKEISLYDFPVDSIVKNLNVQHNKHGQLPDFDQKVKYPKTKALFFVRYFEDRGQKQFMGMRVKSKSFRGNKKLVEYRNSEYDVKKERKAKVITIEFDEEPPWKQAVSATKVLVVNKTDRLISIPMIDGIIGNKKHFHKIWPNREKHVWTYESNNTTVEVQGELFVKDLFQGLKRHGSSLTTFQVPVTSDKLVISNSDLVESLGRNISILNNTGFYAKLIAGFEGVLCPEENREFTILNGQRVQAKVRFYRDPDCKKPLGWEETFVIYATAKPYRASWGPQVYFHKILSVPTEIYYKPKRQ